MTLAVRVIPHGTFGTLDLFCAPSVQSRLLTFDPARRPRAADLLSSHAFLAIFCNDARPPLPPYVCDSQDTGDTGNLDGACVSTAVADAAATLLLEDSAAATPATATAAGALRGQAHTDPGASPLLDVGGSSSSSDASSNQSSAVRHSASMQKRSMTFDSPQASAFREEINESPAGSDGEVVPGADSGATGRRSLAGTPALAPLDGSAYVAATLRSSSASRSASL
jgi:hypothetical protein